MNVDDLQEGMRIEFIYRGTARKNGVGWWLELDRPRDDGTVHVRLHSYLGRFIRLIDPLEELADV